MHHFAAVTETYGRDFTTEQKQDFTPEGSNSFDHKVYVGTVHQVIRGMHLYRVVFDGYQTPMVCTSVSPDTVFQSVSSCSYAVGSRVIVVLTQRFTWGVIVGAIPSEYLQENERSLTTANLVSGVGTYHYAQLEYLKHFTDNRAFARGLADFAYRRTVDHLDGDYTISNIFGGGFHTDPFMSYIRQSHSCGVWTFGIDQLLRLMGRSIQEYSLVHERHVGVDEHESYAFEGMALYPWEGCGLLSPEGDLHTNHDPSELFEQKGIGFHEPADEKREPFYRRQVFSGFIGQGNVDLLVVPPKSQEITDHPIPVSRQQSVMDGTVLVESAKGIHLVRHGNIRAYKRIRQAEDPQGDDQAKQSYEFSSTSVPPPPQNPSLTDQIIHAVREQGNAGFEGHKLDFEKIPEDQRAFEKDVNLANLLDLRSRPEMGKPPTLSLHVDHRYKDVEYSGSRASISLLPEGGIVLRGGCGEEILLQGGNITLSAPGDLRCLLGRSSVILAGDDVVLRAKNSVDVTAADHDVRLKAERNLDMVGGMGGNGRTLLENKSSGLPNVEGSQFEGEDISGAGIMFRAPESVIASYGRRIYTRALERGEIVLDAQGEGSIRMSAREVGVDAAQGVMLGAGTGENVVHLTSSSTRLTKRMELDGQLLVSQTVRADQGCNRDPLDPPNFGDPTEEGMMRREYFDAIPEDFKARNTDHIAETYYDNQGLGSEELIAACQFSYRTSDQCGANRFSFDEPYWMELFGSSVVSALATWEEPIYVYQETVNQTAWPGYKKWVEEECVEVGKTRLYDAQTGRDQDTPVDGDSLPEPQTMTPAEFYRIVRPI